MNSHLKSALFTIVLLSLAKLSKSYVLRRAEEDVEIVSENIETSGDTNMTLLASGSGPYAAETLEVYPGRWGEWKGLVRAPIGFYACGARIRFENRQGRGDDTAANGLKMKFCKLGNWYEQVEKEIYAGLWGGWKSWAMCPYGTYIYGAQIRFEDPIGGGDDTALNGMKIACANFEEGKFHVVEVYSGIWGGWKPWRTYHAKYVNGAQVRFENSIGGGDDTAWNGLRLRVETPNHGVSDAKIKGEWKVVASGYKGKFTHTII